jgi:hypothetical protein
MLLAARGTVSIYRELPESTWRMAASRLVVFSFKNLNNDHTTVAMTMEQYLTLISSNHRYIEDNQNIGSVFSIIREGLGKTHGRFPFQIHR